MKNIIYLCLMTIMLAFVACGGGEAATEETVIETILCADRCQKACCLGCKATEGDKKCIILADGSMPCCIPEEQ